MRPLWLIYDGVCKGVDVAEALERLRAVLADVLVAGELVVLPSPPRVFSSPPRVFPQCSPRSPSARAPTSSAFGFALTTNRAVVETPRPGPTEGVAATVQRPPHSFPGLEGLLFYGLLGRSDRATCHCRVGPMQCDVVRKL